MSDPEDRFTYLLDEADRCCAHFGGGKDLIVRLFRETSSWAFIIQLDALHETSIRSIARRCLSFQSKNTAFEVPFLADKLNYQGGANSLLHLIRSIGIKPELVTYADRVRKIRNRYAHNINNVEVDLLDMILEYQDHNACLKMFSYIEDTGWNVERFVALERENHALLHFGMLHQTMLLLSELHVATELR
ncbi:hypothetical protein ACQ0MK_13650 [Thalassospira lucentensis]|uniref:hypothetical protein n=1 Tax=Thalassospira lucentensis TaxID=168935 RepID=UPI003D2F3B98